MSRHNVDEQIGGAHQDAPTEAYGRGPMTRCAEELSIARALSRISKERKEAPLWSGCMRYFPDALLAVARLSKKANDKHNPGEPMGWSRHKSSDHADCIARHQLEPEAIDPEFNEPHAVMVAWRALAQLQLIEEKRKSDANAGKGKP